jgi:hypothetical protein
LDRKIHSSTYFCKKIKIKIDNLKIGKNKKYNQVEKQNTMSTQLYFSWQDKGKKI